MSHKAIVISGGTIYEELTLNIINKTEHACIIGVDRGVEFLYKNHIQPSYIVGDFDSLSEEIVRYYKEETEIPIRQYNPVKDASDTEIALRLAVTLGCSEICLLGATGGRIDHLWANIQTLVIPFEVGVEAFILDPYNKISLIKGETHLQKIDAYGEYFSVFPLGEVVYGFGIEGAKYPLTNHTLTPYGSLCVSNQIKEEEVVIQCSSGTVILMQTKDK